MSDLSNRNPTGRFTGLAENYAKYRPSYPPEAIDQIVQDCRVCQTSILADIGCGTGISSRLFAERGIQVIGIEPNAEMRAKAASIRVSPGMPAPVYQEGTAEATGLGDRFADAVLAAQAFHWFLPEESLAEFQRILKQGGWAALLWNERDERDEMTKAYGDIIRMAPDTLAVELPRGLGGQPLLASPLFQNGRKLLFYHEQSLDEDGLLGRAFSASYAPRTPEGRAAWTEAIGKIFHQHQRWGKVKLKYETSLYLAQKRD
jgi:SAM-dependent methyltransferase